MNAMSNPTCPQCGKELQEVRYPADSMFNRDQFDSMKAGDWYCEECPDNGRAKSGVCHWWNTELTIKEKL
jgi:hypothetical protein